MKIRLVIITMCCSNELIYGYAVSYLIDIRMAKFLENFVTNENCVCKLPACNAQCSLNKLFVSYGDDIISSCNLRSHVIEKFFE